MVSRTTAAARDMDAVVEDAKPTPQPLGEVLLFMQQLWSLDHALLTPFEADADRDRNHRSPAPRGSSDRRLSWHFGRHAVVRAEIPPPALSPGILRRMTQAGLVRCSSDLGGPPARACESDSARTCGQQTKGWHR